MKTDELISVIIPVYQVEAYLPRCIDSLLAQTQKAFELILVDDGSPDGCGEICESYAARDARVRVIHQQNGGLSAARNAGLAAAQGAWIAFVDSDDWVAPDFLSRMLAAGEDTDADICECSVLRTTGATQRPAGESGRIRAFDAEEAMEQLVSDGLFRQHVWNKLYRASCLAGILFEPGKTNEDEFWTYQVFGRAARIARLDRTLYYYFQRPGSIMGSGYSLRRLDALEAKQARQRYLERSFPRLAPGAGINLFASCIYAGQMSLRCLNAEDRRAAVQRISAVALSCRPTARALAKLPLRQRVWLHLARVDFWGTVRLKNLLKKGL